MTDHKQVPRNDCAAVVIWFTGLSAAGKTTIARLCNDWFFKHHMHSVMLDGDVFRAGLCNDLGFSAADRSENIRRAGHCAHMLFEQGFIVLCSFISPFSKDRQKARDLMPAGRFIEVYCKCPLEICQSRDAKNGYEKALRGEIAEFTGISSPYEEPAGPEICLNTDMLTPQESLQNILSFLSQHKIVTDPLGRNS